MDRLLFRSRNLPWKKHIKECAIRNRVTIIKKADQGIREYSWLCWKGIIASFRPCQMTHQKLTGVGVLMRSLTKMDGAKWGRWHVLIDAQRQLPAPILRKKNYTYTNIPKGGSYGTSRHS